MMNTLGRRLVDSGVLDVLDRFHRDFNALTQGLAANGETLWSPAGMEVWEDDRSVYVEAELPGVKSEDVEVTLEGGTLCIRGVKKENRQDKQVNYHYRSRRYGQFVHQMQLPSSVDPSKVSASLKDGVLRVQVEKRPEVQPRKIEVKAD